MKDSVKFLIEQAMTGYDALTAHDRIRLLRGVESITPEESLEHRAAADAAWLLERAEQGQLTFRNLFIK